MIRKIFLGILLLTPLGFYPLLHTKPTPPDHNTYPPSQQDPLTADQHLALSCFAILPGQAFPGAIPWAPMGDLGQQEERALEELAKKDPVAFLEKAVARVDKEVHGYRCTFDKQERVNSKLRQKERILVHFRADPFSVHMEWIHGAGKAVTTAFVAGENGNLLLVRAFSRQFGPTFHKKLTDPEVLATSRFGIDKFGMHMGAHDTLEHMQAAQQKGTLHVRYDGLERVKQLGGRLCYKFVRTPYDPPEEKEQLNDLTTYIDKTTMLQVGSVLKDTEGKLIAEYFFYDIYLNPTFDEKQFKEEGL